MKFHPDVLAAHAEFGGELEAMQALYDRPDYVARIAELEAKVERLRNNLADRGRAISDKERLISELKSEAAAADQIIAQIEERFPNWRSYRDILDCIDVTLYDLRRYAR